MNKNNLSGNQSDFILYTSNDGDVKVEVVLQDENIWLAQKTMGELFGKDRSVITKHIANIFSSGELDEESSVQKMHFAYSAGEVRRIMEDNHGCN